MPPRSLSPLDARLAAASPPAAWQSRAEDVVGHGHYDAHLLARQVVRAIVHVAVGGLVAGLVVGYDRRGCLREQLRNACERRSRGSHDAENYLDYLSQLKQFRLAREYTFVS